MSSVDREEFFRQALNVDFDTVNASSKVNEDIPNKICVSIQHLDGRYQQVMLNFEPFNSRRIYWTVEDIPNVTN